MDAVSYSHSAKQAQRIEKFIKNPDSNSGIVTVPKVIGAGENITVPAGRVAVLPNVQVDGELVVDGEVFIPSGAGLSTVVQKSGDTMTGNLNFASGTKITGDFSNAVHSNRVAIQTNVTNGVTSPFIIPNGTGAASQLVIAGNSDASNTSYASIQCNNTISKISINSGITGSGTYLPISFTTNGLERVVLDNSGNFLLVGSGGLGYGTGSGGTVTQLTSKSTAVTLNKPCGKITTSGSSIGAGGEVYFIVNNSNVAENDAVLVSQISYSINTAVYDYRVNHVANGSFLVTIKNKSTVSLSEILTIQFVVIKGAIA